MALTGIKGTAEYKRRLKAVKNVFKPIAIKWGDGTSTAYPGLVQSIGAVDNGDLMRSFRVTKRRNNKVVVGGHYTAYFVNKGVVKKSKPRTVFSSKAQKSGGYKARPFLKRGAWEELRKHPMVYTLVDEWNGAA